MSEIMDAYWQAPAMARLVHLIIPSPRAAHTDVDFFRTLTTAIVITSIGCYMGILPFGWFYFAPYTLLRFPPGIWRPFTAFFLSTPKLGIILDPYFVYQYLTQLEVASPRFPRKEDVLWYLLTVGTMIIVSSSLLPILVFQGLSFLPYPSFCTLFPFLCSHQCTCTSAYLPA